MVGLYTGGGGSYIQGDLSDLEVYGNISVYCAGLFDSYQRILPFVWKIRKWDRRSYYRCSLRSRDKMHHKLESCEGFSIF